MTCEPNGMPPFDAVATDISLNGSRLESPEPPDVGTRMTIVVHLPGSDGISRLPATVRWRKPGQFGVQFGLLEVRDTYWIADLMGNSIRPTDSE